VRTSATNLILVQLPCQWSAGILACFNSHGNRRLGRQGPALHVYRAIFMKIAARASSQSKDKGPKLITIYFSVVALFARGEWDVEAIAGRR
jgi:hypothetical protein